MPYTWPVTSVEVDKELNLGADTSEDAELAGFIDAATEVIESIVGPVTSTSYTETLTGGSDTLILSRYPVVSVDTVTEYAGGAAGQVLAAEPLGTSPYTGYGYQVNLATGVLSRTSSGVPWRFADQVVVTYHAGRATVPAAIRLAALELVRHMWESQRGGGLTGLPSLDPDVAAGNVPSDGYLIPNRVAELLAPYRKAPAVA